jgi:hypothetical protein
MPNPKLIDRRKVWDKYQLDAAFEALPGGEFGLGDLPPPAARQLLDKAMLSMARFDDEDIGKTILTQTLLQPASLHNEEYFSELVKICARIAPLDKGRIPQTLRAIFSALAASDALMTLAERSFQSYDHFRYSSLAALFRSDAPLEECDSLVRESASWPRAKALLETQSDSSPAVAKAAAVCRFFEEQTETDHSALTSFAVASVLNAYKIDKIAVDTLSLEQWVTSRSSRSLKPSVTSPRSTSAIIFCACSPTKSPLASKRCAIASGGVAGISSIIGRISKPAISGPYSRRCP